MLKKSWLLLLVASFLLVAVPAHTQTGALSGKKICLDPGHGGSDPGAVYDDGTIYLEEADINLDVAYGLKTLLQDDGADVVMTRTDDSYKSNRDRYTFCNGEAADILVSVHTNSTTDASMDGSMFLYFHSDDEALAQAIYDVMYPSLKATAPDPSNFTGFGLAKFASGVLLKSDMPAAMAEPVLMSNPAEASLLLTALSGCQDCRRAQIASTIHQGVLAYFGAGGANLPPVASFTYACTDLSCDFDGSNSTDPDGSIASYAWDFGDGGTASGSTASHDYTSAGIYSVRLTVTDDDGATGTDEQSVTVGELPDTIHIGDLDSLSVSLRRTWRADVTITVHGAGHAAVAGATVSGSWTGGYSGSAGCVTGSDGRCTVSSAEIRKNVGNVIFTVDNVSYDTRSYDASANHDPDGDSDGTAITVYRP